MDGTRKPQVNFLSYTKSDDVIVFPEKLLIHSNLLRLKKMKFS